MTEKTAWFCPSCQRHHAPHVETCPDSKASKGLPLSPRFYPDHWSPWVVPRHTTGTYDPCANCKGACGNSACPKRGIVTYAGDGGTVWGPQ